MASITDLIDFTKLATSVAKDAGTTAASAVDQAARAAQLFRKAKAISAQANKYVVKYPVLVSTRIAEVKTAVAITKQIELECARFIILAAGMKPLIGGTGDELNNQLNAIFTQESFKNLHLTISPATDEEFYSVENYLKSIENVVPGHRFKEHSSFTKSMEVNSVDTATEQGEEEPDDDSNITSSPIKHGKSNKKVFDTNFLSPDELEYGRQQLGINLEPNENGKIIINGFEYDPNNLGPKDADKIEGLVDKIRTEYNENSKSNQVIPLSSNVSTINEKTTLEYDKVLSSLSKEAPTIIRLDFKIIGANNQVQDISIPLAVKATLIYVDSSDCVDVLSRSKTFSSRLKTALKVISGEICFTDWLFNLKEAQKDIEREKNLNQVPWYRRLLSGKNKYRTKNLLQVLNIQSDFIKGKTKEDMPMCTIVVTDDELMNVGYRISKLLQDSKIVNSIIDEYMLLCFGVVDYTNDMVYFFFAGEDDYRAIDINKVGTRGGSNTDITGKLVGLLGKSIDINNRH